MRLQLVKRPEVVSTKNETRSEKQKIENRSFLEFRLILQKKTIQKRLNEIQDSELFEEKAQLISKLSKIEVVRIKYENELQQELNSDFYNNPANKFLMGLGVAATISGIGLLAALHPAAYGVAIFGVAALIIGLHRKKLVRDLSEEEIMRRISIKVNEDKNNSSS